MWSKQSNDLETQLENVFHVFVEQSRSISVMCPIFISQARTILSNMRLLTNVTEVYPDQWSRIFFYSVILLVKNKFSRVMWTTEFWKSYSTSVIVIVIVILFRLWRQIQLFLMNFGFNIDNCFIMW
jgi:hypothetical protein